jgi:glycosyltransferase involved in cell wall biosynthesis
MDGFIFLTKYMAGKFRLDRKPIELVEGCVDPEGDAPHNAAVLRGPERIVMYAGGLAAAYGVRMLVQAFMSIKNPNYRLWICGRGEMEAEIRQSAKEDPRIAYSGVLANPEVLRREHRATVLVNPRPSHSEFAKYSFPSKNLEYLGTGRPVILCRLPGIPEEYFDYVYPLEDESVHGMATLLHEVLEKPDEELDAFGRRARAFVLENKNYKKQGEKIRRVIDTVLWRSNAAHKTMVGRSLSKQDEMRRQDSVNRSA